MRSAEGPLGRNTMDGEQGDSRSLLPILIAYYSLLPIAYSLFPIAYSPTSLSVGIDPAAPRRVTLMDEALLARRMQSLSGMPAISPAMK